MMMHHAWQEPVDDIIKWLELGYSFDKKTNSMNIICEWCPDPTRPDCYSDPRFITFHGETYEELQDARKELEKYDDYLNRCRIKRGDEVDA